MAALYIVSAEAAAGKTAICAALGKSLVDSGKKVGFLKPGAAADDGDVAFMKRVLILADDAASLSPPADAGRVKEACDRAARGKDLVLLEGDAGTASRGIARALNARVLAVQDYSRPADAGAYQGFGESLLGIIWNKVPQSQLQRVRDAAEKNVLGVLPEARALAALTIGELADSIQGKMLNNPEKSGELAENYLLGAMVVDSGLDYFGRKAAKAAIVRGDRPDMQLAALETDTRCLVVSGGAATPMYSVRFKAEKKGIPIILSERDSGSIAADIEAALNRARFNQPAKAAILAEMLGQQLDLPSLYRSLGVAG